MRIPDKNYFKHGKYTSNDMMMLKRKKRMTERTVTISTYRAYCALVIISSALHMLIGLVPTIILSDRFYYYSHFINEETEIQKD